MIVNIGKGVKFCLFLKLCCPKLLLMNGIHLTNELTYGTIIRGYAYQHHPVPSVIVCEESESEIYGFCIPVL